jgi:hypothetical protein
MTANTNLERRVAEHYASEPLLRAPDRVLHAALASIETTKQRRELFAPWRFTKMPTYAKVAAAVAVIAVVAVGVWQFAAIPGPGRPAASPTPSPSPTAAATRAAIPTTAPYVPPELTGAFTSDIHGITMSYPDGWTVQKATESWVETGFINFRLPSGDFMYDPARTDHLFLEAGSQPLGDASFDAWSTATLAPEPDCTETEPIVVDGAEGVLSVCNWALVARGGRGYFIAVYTSGDDSDLQTFDSKTWFKEILTTVQLQPRDAVDLEPTETP